MNFIRKIVTQSSNVDDKVFYGAMRNLLKFKPYQIENYQKAFTHRSLKKVDKKGKPFCWRISKRFQSFKYCKDVRR